MMAAVQPFISGASARRSTCPRRQLSKMLSNCTIDAWKMGIKAVAIYRDNCKVGTATFRQEKRSRKQPETRCNCYHISAITAVTTAEASMGDKIIVKGAVRRLLPRRRKARRTNSALLTSLVSLLSANTKMALPASFLRVSKQGSTLSGLMDSFAISVSHGLQYGVPLKSTFVRSMSSSFAPAGITDDEDIRTATSITDYIFRRLLLTTCHLTIGLSLAWLQSKTC